MELDHRPESSLRLLYQAEVKVIRDQHGGLEEIRQKLGFSRRKMCQLLLVDPSAWTRWCRDESRVPPHIFRALEWFLALNQRAYTHPEVGEWYLGKYRAQSGVKSGESERLKLEIQTLKRDLRRQWGVIFLLMGALLVLALGRVAL